MYEFCKYSFSSTQLLKFLWLIAVRGSPLMRFNTNFYKIASCSGLITAKAVSTFPIKANTSCLSPLNGGTNFKASPRLINSLLILLTLLLTVLCVLDGFMDKVI